MKDKQSFNMTLIQWSARCVLREPYTQYTDKKLEVGPRLSITIWYNLRRNAFIAALNSLTLLHFLKDLINITKPVVIKTRIYDNNGKLDNKLQIFCMSKEMQYLHSIFIPIFSISHSFSKQCAFWEYIHVQIKEHHNEPGEVRGCPLVWGLRTTVHHSH